MNKILFLLVASLFASNNSVAQTASTREVEIYSGIKGKVYSNEAFFVNAPDSPVQIKDIKATHTPSETASLAEEIWKQLGRNMSESAKAQVRLFAKEGLNITIDAEGEDAVAVKFGVVAYDAFKEYLGGLTAITMDPPKKSMEWDFKPAYLFKFEKYGVVSVYVRQVRLKNGRIWNYTPEIISKELSQKYGQITKDQVINVDLK